MRYDRVSLLHQMLQLVDRMDAQLAAFTSGVKGHVPVASALTQFGNSSAAGIAIDTEGRCLYASNRGHDSIAAFRIDPGSGFPRFVEAHASQGRTPRFFTLSPDGRLLFALNEESDTIVAFDVDESGGLHGPRQAASCGSPVCMVFFPPAR